MPLKVSVIVPVYDPGPYIEPHIDSLLGQSLASDEFEILYVDDGSTDGTGSRLGALASEHQHIRVIHTPNSGWPGRPRNIGIDEARGEYVQLVDQDDRLGPEALERLYEMGRRNRSDIVMGKVTSDFRRVPNAVFQINREACTVHDAPLIESLTPHKLFRTAFLRDRQIRFPEGPWILEDQLFMVRAYLQAQVVSILADYPCYFYWGRGDAGNAYTARFEPEPYFANLRTIMALVVSETEPGPFRDGLLRRSYRSELIGRLAEPVYPGLPVERRHRIFEAARALAQEPELVPDTVHAALSTIPRTRSALLRDGREDDVLDLARRLESAVARYQLESWEWARGRLVLHVRIGFVHAEDGDALIVHRRGERYYLDPRCTPPSVDLIDVTDDMDSIRVNASVRDSHTGIEWRARSIVDPDGVGATSRGSGLERSPVAVRAVVTVDPRVLAGGRPLDPGAWDLILELGWVGLRRSAEPAPEVIQPAIKGPRLALLGDPAKTVAAGLTAAGSVVLCVEPDHCQPAVLLGHGSLSIEPSDGRHLRVWMPIASVPGTSRTRAELVIRGALAQATVPAFLSTDGARQDRIVLAARVDGTRLPEGPATITLRWIGGPTAEVPLGACSVSRAGQLHVDGAGRISRVAAIERDAARRAVRWGWGLRRLGGRMRRSSRSARAPSR
jgi:glycosyltransferase involved in cell wall biosynthesis